MKWLVSRAREGSKVAAVALLVTLAPVAWSPTVRAQESDQELERARELYRQGIQLEAASDWAGALAKFEAVARIKMSPQVRFHIARSQHKLGKLLQALGGYRLAAHEAASDPKAADVVQEAQAAIEEIEKKIPKIVIERAEGFDASQISLDGVALGEASIGTPVPVDPGLHTIGYTLPNGKTEKQVIRIQEEQTKTVTLAAKAEAEPVTPPPDTASEGPGPWPWVAIGVGGASLVGSGVFYLLRSSAVSDLEDACPNNVCPTSMKDTGDKGQTYTTLGNVTLGVGLVGVAVGTIWLLTSSDGTATEAPSTSAAPKMTLMVGGTGRSAEATLVGTF